MPQNFEVASTIFENVKSLYRQYESMKGHQKDVYNFVELKASIGFPTQKSQEKVEPHTKAR